MKVKFGVQWFEETTEKFKVFTSEKEAKDFFQKKDENGLVASWGDYVISPFVMFLVTGESRARKELRTKKYAEAQKRKAERQNRASK